AKIVLVDATTSVSVVAPGNQASYVGQSVSLQMIGSGPTGSVLTWSAAGLPAGLSIDPATGRITGTPTATGTSSVRVTLSNGNSSDFEDFTWTIQPQTFSQNFPSFTGASSLTLNGNAAIIGGVLRLAPNLANQVGSAFLSSPLAIGPNSSINTRWIFNINGSADGADGLTFVIQGNGATSLGLVGGGLGYDGIGKSVAVEIDNYQGPGDPNANHIDILSNGNVVTHLATFTPGWDLEDGQSHTIWVEYDGPANERRVYAAQGIVSQRPANPVPTGLSINPASGLISGTPTVAGVFSPTVTVTDGNTLPVNASFTWTINNVLTVQPLAGAAVPAGTTVSMTAQASGGLNPQFRW